MNVSSLDLHRNLTVKGCPFCGDSLSALEKENCPTCGSAARTRSLVPILREAVHPLLSEAPLSKPLLGFAVTSAERKMLDQHFPHFKSVSLFGNYSSNHETGVDARDLSRYADNSFSATFGILIFDYFVEHEAALRECYRTLALGGIFFTLIAPYRLLDGSQPPFIDRMIKSRPGYFDYVPEGKELANVKVGREWFVTAMQQTGFQASRITVKDEASGVLSEWFMGVKPKAGSKRTEDKITEEPSVSTPPTSFSVVYRCAVCNNSFEGQTKIENCPVCGAPPRARTLSPVLHGFVEKNLPAELRERLPVLAVSMPPIERKQIEKIFSRIRSVSLYGSYASDGHELGVDVRNLTTVEDGSCSAHFGIGIFDYFPEHDQALAEAFRILAPGGVLFTHILPHRLLDGNEPPTVTHQIKSRPGYFDYLPQGTELPSIRVGRHWFLAAMERAGFNAQYIVIHDAASATDIGWFVGIKSDNKSSAAVDQQKESHGPPKNLTGALPVPQRRTATDISRKPALRSQRPWYKKVLTRLGLRKSRDKAEAARNLKVKRGLPPAQSPSTFAARTAAPVERAHVSVIQRPSAPKTYSSDRKTYTTPLPRSFGSERITVTLSLPQLPLKGDFAEHVFDTEALVPTDQIIVVTKGGVIVSKDLGASWKHITLPETRKIQLKNCLTLSDGSHLLQGTAGSALPVERAKNADLAAPILHFDSSWNFLGRYQPGKCHWHGSRSIDQSGDTIIYAEYPDNSAAFAPDFESRRNELLPRLESAAVFKSADKGKTWRKVFEANWQDIRHFHTVAIDPFQPGTWWLSSGDRPRECRIWRSTDDGDTWTEVQGVPSIDLPNAHYKQAAFRYTDIQILPDRLIWGSDDWLHNVYAERSEGAGSRVFASTKDTPLCPESLGRIGSPVRSIVDVGRAYLLITEAKHIHVSPRPQVFLMLKEKPNTLIEVCTVDTFGTGTGFTYSMASRAAKDGRFFTYRNRTDVFPDGPRILQWDISFD